MLYQLSYIPNLMPDLAVLTEDLVIRLFDLHCSSAEDLDSMLTGVQDKHEPTKRR